MPDDGPEVIARDLYALGFDPVPSPGAALISTIDAVAAVLASIALSKVSMNVMGDHVIPAATLDYRGLAMLERKISGLKALIAPDEDDDDAIEDDG